MTPLLFIHNMYAQARREPQHILMPEGHDVRVVAAAAELVSRGICQVTLCGDPAVIRANAAHAHVNLSPLGDVRDLSKRLIFV